MNKTNCFGFYSHQIWNKCFKIAKLAFIPMFLFASAASASLPSDDNTGVKANAVTSVVSNQKTTNHFLPAAIDQQQNGRHVVATVIDSKGEPVIGANVAVKGTTIGNITDVDGKVSLDVPKNATLVISYIGYKSQEILVGNRNTIQIRLLEDTQALDEVVVVAYGTAKKKDLTGSLTAVDSKLLNVQSVTSVTNYLEGSVPGVQVAQADGQPGWDMGMRVRGLGSANPNNADALVVIDGVPSSYANALSSINSKDIESVTVLKDAASTALYGSRGANGVVMVTTKKGSKGKTKINFEGRWGINQMGPNTYDRMTKASDIYEYAWQTIYNSARYGNANGIQSNYSNNITNPNMSSEAAAQFASAHLFDYAGSLTNFKRNTLGNWMLYNVPGAVYTSTGSGSSASSTMSGAYLVNTDGKINPNATQLFGTDSYYKELLKNVLRQEYNISASGGSDKSKYYVSLGYLDNPSYITGSAFKRYNIRTSLDSQIYSWLKAGVNMAYTYRNTKAQATRWGRNPGNSQQNVFNYINNQLPLVSLYARDASGNIIMNSDGTKMVHTTEGQSYSPLGPTGSPLFSKNDILKILDMDKDQTLSNDVNINAYATIIFLKDFSFTNNLSAIKYFDNRTRYQNSATGQVAGDGAYGKVVQDSGYLTLQQLLNWSHEYGSHHIDALIGHEFNSYDLEGTFYKSSDELVPGFDTYVNFVGRYQGGTFSNPGGTKEKTRMEGYFSRVNYNYNQKYYLEGSLRRDGSSKFKLKDKRWGTFWSVGAGWRVTGEDFLSGTKDWLNNLKLRASYGVIGNQNGIANYSGYQTWGYSAATFAASTSGGGDPTSYKLSKNSYVNSNLTWENVHTFDVGADFTLFGRLSGTIDYYNRKTVNAIWNQPIASSLGQTSISSNSAAIRNRGLEVELNYDIIKNKDFYWSVSTNGTTYTTELTKVPDGVGSEALGGCWTSVADVWSTAGASSYAAICYLRGVGKPFYNMYLYKYGGVAGNPGKEYYCKGVKYSGDASSAGRGSALYGAKVTDANIGNFPGAKVGDDVLTTNYNQASRYEYGSAIPKWIGGLSTFIQYKDFDFTAAWAYQLGGKYYSVEYGDNFYLSENWNSAGKSRELVGNTWTENNTGAKFPMLLYNNSYGNGSKIGDKVFTDMALFSASYLSFKNITLGYTLPTQLLQKYNISKLRVFVTGNNLLLYTDHSGIDPRMSLVGGMEIGASTYPYVRTYSVGLDVEF